MYNFRFSKMVSQWFSTFDINMLLTLSYQILMPRLKSHMTMWFIHFIVLRLLYVVEHPCPDLHVVLEIFRNCTQIVSQLPAHGDNASVAGKYCIDIVEITSQADFTAMTHKRIISFTTKSCFYPRWFKLECSTVQWVRTQFLCCPVLLCLGPTNFTLSFSFSQWLGQ